MKVNILWAAGAAALMLSACSNRENPFETEEYDGPTGQLSTAELMVSVTVDDDVRTRAVDTGGFIVEIKKGDVVKYSYTYASLPEVITLPAGADYTVDVKSADKAEDAAWEAPYYVGSENFEISANKITEVKPVVCKRENVRVTVRYDEQLKALMGEDAGVTVDAGEGRSVNLRFGKDETRDGYFALNDNWTTLVARFEGTIDGHKEDFTKLYSDVKAGDHFIITYAYSSPSDPTGNGGINAEEITIDSRVERVDKDGKVSVVEEVITGDGRPSDGEEEKPDPNPGGGDEPVVKAPVIEAEAPIDLDKVNVVNGESIVKLTITSETGITAFTVDIDSPVLTPSELEGVGLASHLDLVDPGDLEDTLRNFGFPVGSDVRNQKNVAFDITGFMKMLCAVGAGYQHNFVLTVTDAGGTTEKTLKLKVD